MSDLISRQEAIDAIIMLGIKRAVPILVTLPSAEPERTVKVDRCSFGETLTYDFDGQCECGKWVDALWDYCPSCGAKLEWNE